MNSRNLFPRILLAAGLAFALRATAAGAAAPGPKAELHVAGLGWWQNRELRLSREAVGQAAADIESAAARPNPTLSFNVSSIYTQHGIGAGAPGDKRMDSVVRIDQTIERGGKRDSRERQAEARQFAAAFDLADTLRRKRIEASAA